MGIITVSFWYLVQRLLIQQIEDIGATLLAGVTFLLSIGAGVSREPLPTGEIKNVAGK
jgi:hypothetical protein